MVLDASLALEWCFPDEHTESGDEFLRVLKNVEIFVPTVWPMEIANAMLVGERAGRLGPREIARFLDLVQELGPQIESSDPLGQLEGALRVGREHQLSAYDASYLALAMTTGAALATLDRRLRQAAERAGVALLKP